MLSGRLLKMQTQLSDPVQYTLPVGEASVALNPLIGQSIQLQFTGKITCINCNRVTKKSFSQGYCFPCMQSLAACDICIVKPERCHYDQGTCREPDWGEQHCMQPHFLYLANSSGIKVGITRGTQIPTRWIDQGAYQALPVMQVATRYQVGLLEVAFKDHVADKTNWRIMLKGAVEKVDLFAARDALLRDCSSAIEAVREKFQDDAVTDLGDASLVEINYPVLTYPSKITSLNFDKTPTISGVLQGIKGQYLLLDSGVLNIRKFTGYNIEFN